eukprot:28694-Pyramimonas_sp.AAC.1
MDSPNTQAQEPREYADEVFAKLQNFFPSTSGEIIRETLFANDGNVEATIDQLLPTFGQLLDETEDPPSMWGDDNELQSSTFIAAVQQQQQQLESDEALSPKLWNLQLENAEQRRAPADTVSISSLRPRSSSATEFPAPLRPRSSSATEFPAPQPSSSKTSFLDSMSGALKDFITRRTNSLDKPPTWSPDQSSGQGQGAQLLQVPLKLIQGFTKAASDGVLAEMDGAAGKDVKEVKEVKDGVVSKARGDVKLGDDSSQKRTPSGLLRHQIVDVE